MGNAQGLVDAIGIEATLKLRDWLIRSFPPETAPVPRSQSTTQQRDRDANALAQRAMDRFNAVHGDPLVTMRSLHERVRAAREPRFYAEPYQLRNREWYRVVDRGTGKVAKLPIRQGREYVKQDMFMTLHEARISIEALNAAFGLPDDSGVSSQV